MNILPSGNSKNSLFHTQINFCKQLLSRKPKAIGFYAWKPADAGLNIPNNFGDDLFVEITSKILGKNIEVCGINYLGRKLLLGGSTVNLAKNGDWIWGAGIRDGQLPKHIQDVKVFAVRGPLTACLLRERGINTPECFGDPAILTPDLFPEWGAHSKKWEVGVIPHYTDLDYISNIRLPPKYRLISPTQSCKEVIHQITECKGIMASSLHGIICAEAYGIPTISFRTSSATPEPDFKYKDYFAATNREWRPAKNFLVAVNASFNVAPDFSNLSEKLKKAFPKSELG